MDVLLGLDLGTTNIKGVAYSVTGAPLALASRPTPTMVQGVRRANLDPQALWCEMAAVLREVAGALPVQARPAGLAIASFGEAGVPLDAHGQPVYPIIAWYDERTAPQSAWWVQQMGATAIYRYTGLPPGHTFTLNKLLWLRQEEPQVYARICKWLCVSDYMAYRLTGTQCMGYSLASRTMALDLGTRRWSEEMLAAMELKAEVFPPLQPEGSLVGQVTADVARETGLPSGLPVYVGGHDHVCGALAMGVFNPGVVLDSTGTTEAELAPLESVREHLQAADLSFCLGCHVARGRYYALGSVLGAGGLVNWLANLLWPAEAATSRDEAIQSLTHAAGESPLGAHGLYLLPHLAGAGSPHRDSTARGVWVGLTLTHSRADMARAVIEGLGYELRVLWEALAGFTGRPIERVVTIGGGARNPLWMQIKADITGRDLLIPQQTEAVTLGAALLAGLGAGVYRNEEEANSLVSIPIRRVQPHPEHAQRYEQIYQHVRDEIRPLAMQVARQGHILENV